MKFDVYMINGDFTFAVSKKDLECEFGWQTLQKFLCFENQVSIEELKELVSKVKARRVGFSQTGRGKDLAIYEPKVFKASLLKDFTPFKTEVFSCNETFAFVINKKEVKDLEDIDLIRKMVYNQYQNYCYEWGPSREFIKDVLEDKDIVGDLKEFTVVIDYTSKEIETAFINPKCFRESYFSILTMEKEVQGMSFSLEYLNHE